MKGTPLTLGLGDIFAWSLSLNTAAEAEVEEPDDVTPEGAGQVPSVGQAHTGASMQKVIIRFLIRVPYWRKYAA